MKILYLDCFAGISGDMTLGAFIDLGVDKDLLINELKKLNIDGYSIQVSKKSKCGIMATDVDVILEQNHDHDHSHHNGHTHDNHNHGHTHHHHDDENSHEDHSHDHNHNNHEHHHRSFSDIKEIILKSSLEEEVKNLSIEIFNNLAIAEAKIHGKTVDEVHFHEVGAIDSIVDIVGASICINEIKADKIVASSLCTGFGLIKCDHGIMPVPAPATLEIIKNHNIEVHTGNINKEMTTPTGAAIVATVCDSYGNMPNGTPINIGYGSGKRDLDIANVLRVVVIEDKKKH